MPIVNQADIAVIFGVQPRTVRSWVRCGLPEVQRGGSGRPSLYNTAEVARWREEQAALAATAAEPADIETARRRKLFAEAGLAEMELGMRRGELISIEHVGAVVESEYAVLRSLALSLPGEMASELAQRPKGEIEVLLSAKIAEILGALQADEDLAPEEAAAGGER